MGISEVEGTPGFAVSRRAALMGALGAGVATLALMLATAPSLAIVWDEAYTLARVDRVRMWVLGVRKPSAFPEALRDWRPLPLEDGVNPGNLGAIDERRKLFERNTLRWFWPFAREEPHGHPPVYAEVALVGDGVAPGWGELARARLGTMGFHSLAAGAIVGFLARRRGWWAAGAAGEAWSLQPHLFALAHYATYDALLTSLWVLAGLAFFLAAEARSKVGRWGWILGFGVVLGLAMGTKLTGWLIPIPALVWGGLYRSRGGFWAVLGGILVGLVVVVAVTPPFWIDPVGGLIGFFRSNLTRAQTIPIRTMFLGAVYNTPRESLPWYNTVVWTVLVTPVGLLVLALAGSGRSLRNARVDRFGVLMLMNWGFLLVLRALPHAPGHDGVRQFLPAFGWLAVSVGLGAGWVSGRRWGRWLVGVSMAEAAVSVGLMMPVPLSYFSPVVGGLPGAAAVGMEPTFYWDALTDRAIEKLNERTGAGENVLFMGYPIVWYQERTGALRAGVAPKDGPDFEWVVVQNRPGSMSEVDRALVRRLGDDPEYILSEKLGVPLIWAFPGDAPELSGVHEQMRRLWENRRGVMGP